MGFYEDYMASQGPGPRMDNSAMSRLYSPGQTQQQLLQGQLYQPAGPQGQGPSPSAQQAANEFDPWGLVKDNQAKQGSPSSGNQAVSGAMKGASIGTSIAPGIGTAVGIIGGGILGALGIF